MASRLHFIKEAIAVGVSTVTINDCFPAGYDAFQIIVNPIEVDSFDYWYMKVCDSSGGTVSASEYDYHLLDITSWASYANHKAQNQTSALIGFGGAKTEADAGGFNITMFNPSNSSSYTSWVSQSAVYRTTSGLSGGKAMGIHKVDELITGIQVFANSGAAGNVTIKVYGIK